MIGMLAIAIVVWPNTAATEAKRPHGFDKK